MGNYGHYGQHSGCHHCDMNSYDTTKSNIERKVERSRVASAVRGIATERGFAANVIDRICSYAENDTPSMIERSIERAIIAENEQKKK